MKNRNLEHSDNWQTPPEFYAKLDAKYHFDFDPCPLNHDISLWDGLKVDWGARNFVNPPYSQKLKEVFIERAVLMSEIGKMSVCLIPVSTSTKLFHDVIKPNAKKIVFLRGRLPFIGTNDKGQLVNHHLLGPVDKSEMIQALVAPGITLSPTTWIPKYVKNSGQHDSMLVII